MRRTTVAVTTLAVLTALLMTSVTLGAQAYRPTVAMSVTLPNGQAQDLSVPESGTQTVTVGGHEYGFRPTMMDDLGERIVITVFDMGSATEAVKVLGEADAKAGGPVVTFKTTPVFKVKVVRVTKPATTTN
jgi:hypothetical protein